MSKKKQKLNFFYKCKLKKILRFKGTSSCLDFRISYIALNPLAVPDEFELKITRNSCAPNVEIIGPGNIIQQCFAKDEIFIYKKNFFKYLEI